MPWITTSETTTYEAKPGQDMVTTVLENLDVGANEPQWPADSFNREMSSNDGRLTARYSRYNAQAQPSYLIRGSLSQEPLATHPKFNKGTLKIEQSEWADYRKWQADPSSTTWTPQTASVNFKKFYSFIERGVEYFLNGTCEVQVTEIVRNTPSMRNLGRIDAPEVAPTLQNGRDWLIVGIDAERIGDDWRQTITYRASMDNGWDNDLYRYG